MTKIEQAIENSKVKPGFCLQYNIRKIGDTLFKIHCTSTADVAYDINRIYTEGYNFGLEQAKLEINKIISKGGK